MKKIILFTLLSFLTINLTAQKARVRSVGFRYYHLPANPLKGDVTTYATVINNTSTKVKVDAARENAYLVLQGFEKTIPSKAGVLIEFSIYYVQAKVGIKSKEVTKKVDGESVKRTKYYYYISSKTSADFKLKYMSGQVIKSASFNGGDFLYEDESSLYDSKDEAAKAFNKDKVALEKNADNAGLELVLKWIKKYLDNNHGYYYTTKYVSISTGKGKKHDYTDLDEALALYKEAAAEYGVNEISQAFIDKSNKCIEVWKAAISEFDASNKKARISRKNIDEFYANIAFAYLYMNEFEKARKTVEQALTVGKADGLEKSYIRQINDREKRYKANEKRKKEFSTSAVIITTNNNSNTNNSTSSGNNNSTSSGNNNSTSSGNGNSSVKNTGAKLDNAIAVPLKGINPAYRVKKVLKTYKSGMNEYVEASYFYYDGGKLKYMIKDANKRVDSIVYIYDSGEITEKTYYYVKSMGKKWLEDSKKEATYDVVNNLVVSKSTNKLELIYHYNPVGGLDALIRKNKLYDKVMYKYTFGFAQNKLAQIKTFRFRSGKWEEETDLVLNFNNRNFTVQQADYGIVYELDYRNGPLSRIQKYRNFNVEKEDMSYTFFYDANGNIIKQKFKNSYGDNENYEIQYEKGEGNEELFLGTKDWRANTFFHQITFNDFFEASY